MAFLRASLVLLLATSWADVFLVRGLKMQMRGTRRVGGTGEGSHNRGLLRSAGDADLANLGDLRYTTEVMLGGREFQVVVDSGSSDLWVAGEVPQSNATSYMATITSVDDTVAGNIHMATLSIEGEGIPNQAYIQRQADPNHPDGEGVLGIGPSSFSSVRQAVKSSAGDSPLDRLFKQDANTSNYATILLDRVNDIQDGVTGQFTVGETIPEWSKITRMPVLPADQVDDHQHWMVRLDKGGIVGPDGKSLAATRDSQLNVIFDIGFSLSQVPKAVADAIYTGVPGANFTSVAGVGDVWVLPCDYELNVAFKFSGISYPMHPLDTVMNDFTGPPDASGNPTCIGSLQPLSNINQPYDMILGQAFLRNVYILLNYGDFIDGSLATTGAPYVQLLSITNPAQAHLEFVQQRLAGLDTTGSQILLPPSTQHTIVLAKRSSSDVHRDLPWIIAGGIVGFLLLAFIVAALVIYIRGRRYRSLEEPAPEGVGAPDRPASAKLDPEMGMVAPTIIPVTNPIAGTRYGQAMGGLVGTIPPKSHLGRFHSLEEESTSPLEDTAKLVRSLHRSFLNLLPTPPETPIIIPDFIFISETTPPNSSANASSMNSDKPLPRLHDSTVLGEVQARPSMTEDDEPLPSPFDIATQSTVQVDSSPVFVPIAPLRVMKRSNSSRPSSIAHGHSVDPSAGRAATFDMARTSRDSQLYTLPTLEISTSSLAMSWRSHDSGADGPR